MNEEEVDQTVVVNNSDLADKNESGCGEAASDSADKLECFLEMAAEDDADGTITTDELRPMKKAKSVVEEKCCFEEEVNGCLLVVLE